MNHPNRPRTSSLWLLLATTCLSLTGGCGGLSLGGGLGARSPANTPHSRQSASEPATSPQRAASSADAATDETAFVGLTEEANQENARRFKAELRTGRLAGVFEEGALLAEVTTACGIKVWEECLVAHKPRGKGQNQLDWDEYTFKRRDTGRGDRYPEMFFARAEPTWATLVAKLIIEGRREAGPALLKMTQDKCGEPLDTQCDVRQLGGGSYVLTVRATGEVIDVVWTLDQWKRDL